MGRRIDGLRPILGTAAGLTAVAWLASFGPIADDVAARARAALESDAQPWARVAIDGRDVTLSGVAPTPGSPQLALEAADRVFGVRVVASRATVLPLADPYLFAATRDGDRLTLRGSIPSDAARAALIAAAGKIVSSATITDQLTVARGAPADFVASASFALGQLADLVKGSVELAPAGYTIAGDPKDWPTYARLEQQLKAPLPGALKLAADRLVPPIPKPYRFALTSVGGAATLDGHLPDAATKAKVLDAVRALFGAGVVDRVEVVPGAPAGFAETFLALLASLTRLRDGAIALSDAEVSVTGGALTDAIARQIVDRLKGLLPAGFKLAGPGPSLLPPPPQVDAATCQALLTKVQTGEKILFETGRAALDQRSIGVLDALVAGSLACTAAHVTVEGHTDAVGDPEANQALSEARAAAVVDHLVAAGIAADRLTAVGYGETRPVASNDTDDGRQQNRRIDFRVE